MAYCECGCGKEIPPVGLGSRRKDGTRKLYPSTARFLRGHGNRGPRPATWKGETVGYSGLHMWLRNNYPKTGRCDHCGNTDRRTEYALIRDREYSRERADYLELCKACHAIYDQVIDRGPAPLCKCGCGEPVSSYVGRKKWHLYVSGHYHPAAHLNT